MSDQAEEQMLNLLKNIAQNPDISSHDLEFLLDCRAKNKIHFTLVDIREVYEYSSFCIKGTDLLLPTSNLHIHMDQLLKFKESFIIFYCLSGGRTSQVLHILRRMGFLKIAHLSRGIIDFSGEKLKNAPLPKNIK